MPPATTHTETHTLTLLDFWSTLTAASISQISVFQYVRGINLSVGSVLVLLISEKSTVKTSPLSLKVIV